MPKKKIGLRGRFLREKVSPLATTGQRRISEGWKSFWDEGQYPLPRPIKEFLGKMDLHRLRNDFYCLEVYETSRISRGKVIRQWFKECHPMGYGTGVIVRKKGEYFFVVMTRNHSCD